MIRAWRLVKEKHAAAAFTGEGAAKHGGRWNSRGGAVVYCSGSKSLAALETLVHLNPRIQFRYVIIEIRFEDSLVERLSMRALPGDWQAEPPGPASKSLGDAWARAGRSAVLAVPSVIIPDEPNYLLNPAHTGFRKITIGKPETFTFDPRLAG